MGKRLNDLVTFGIEEQKQAVLAVSEKFNDVKGTIDPEDFKSAPEKYYGHVVKYFSGDAPMVPLYGFLVHGGFGESEYKLIRITRNGKKDKIIPSGKDGYGHTLLAMGTKNGEPHFIPKYYATRVARNLGLISE